MEITLHTRTLELDDEMRDTLLRRLRFALDAFESRIESVFVSLEDVNGPRGGVDKRCSIHAVLRRAGKVLVRASAPTLPAALGSARGRLKYRLSQSLRQLR